MVISHRHVGLCIHLDAVKVPLDDAIFQGVKGNDHATAMWTKVPPGKFKAVVEFVELVVDKYSQCLENFGGRVSPALQLVHFVVSGRGEKTGTVSVLGQVGVWALQPLTENRESLRTMSQVGVLTIHSLTDRKTGRVYVLCHRLGF